MFTLLTFAAVLKVLSALYLKDGYSTWEADCCTSGISPHPLDCHAFALCQNDSIQLYTCPPHSGYSQIQQACLPLHLISNSCMSQPKLDDEKFIKLMPAANNKGDTVPVCNPQGRVLGLLQCPPLNDKDLDYLQKRRCIAAAKTCQASASRKPLILKEDLQQINLSQKTETSAVMTSVAPSLSSEHQNVEINPGEEEFPPVVCKEKGLHCADDFTIADCSDVSEEPLFSMSCSSLLHDDSGANAKGHCEEASCVLSTRGLALQLPVVEFSADNPDVPEQFLKECSEHVGLRCIDNHTLVACAGNLDTTNYAISCLGNSSSPDIGLQGYCSKDTDSCVFLTPEERTPKHPNKDHKYNSSMDKENEPGSSTASDIVTEDHDTSLFVFQMLSQGFSDNQPSQNLLRGSHTSNKS